MRKSEDIESPSDSPLSLTTTHGKAKKSRQTFGLILLFISSFVFFIYLSFPYGVVKEWISAYVAKESGIRFRMDELSPNLPIGISARGIELEGRPGQPPARLRSIDLEIGLFSLLIGRLAIDLEINDDKAGALDLGVRMNLIKAAMDGAWIPSVIKLEAKQFAIGPLMAYALGKAAEGQGNSNPIVKELLENIVFVGRLEGVVDFDINPGDPLQSKGQSDLKLVDAKLSFANPSLNISPQSFETAALKAQMRDGNLVIDRTSRFKSEGLDFELDGKINFKENFDKSTAEIDLSLKLDQDLKQNYGFLLGSEGQLSGTLRGVLSQVQFAKK